MQKKCRSNVVGKRSNGIEQQLKRFWTVEVGKQRCRMKIGVRAHDYGKRKIEEMAVLLRDEGYGAAQLVLPKAFMEIGGYGDVTPEILKRVRRAFERNDVEIPVLGCYMDLGNPDAQVREYAVRTLEQCLVWAKELGAGVVGTETAYPRLTRAEKQTWKPFMLESIERVMDTACREDVCLALEPVYWHPLTDLETTLEVVRMVGDEKHLRLIFDASNLLEFPDRTDQDALWTGWLEKIGRYVDVMHIKDFSLDRRGRYQPEPLGKGVMRYEAVSRWLEGQKREISLIREEMNLLFVKEDLAFMRNL